MSVGPIDPFLPAAVHASFTAWTLPRGWLLRNFFTNVVLPWSLVAFLGVLGDDFSLAAFVVFPLRLPVSPSLALVLSTTGLLIVPVIPAAAQAWLMDS